MLRVLASLLTLKLAVAMVPALPPPNSGQWNFAAFSCFSNIDICCYTMFCGLCAGAEVRGWLVSGDL